MSAPDLARRFLHINLNTVDADAAQRFFTDGLGLELRMRTDPEVLTDGEILGLSGKVCTDTRFLYDSRGPRTSCAIEVIEWLDPPTVACGHPGTASVGLAALGFVVADRAVTVERISGQGFDVICADTAGLIPSGPATFLVGPDSVVIEIGDLPGAASGTVQFAGARIACADLDASLAFYNQIGFDQISVGAAGHDDIHVCHIGLPEDADSTRLCLTQATATDAAATRKEPNQQGLCRCALRVESTKLAVAATANSIAVRGPIRCPLPGTPIAGLDIAFVTDPDGVVIEYVERPLSHFSGPANERMA
jgi:catechol 2,3-dioxygenase-like lactoylglutathione lyase family enzyme